MDSYVSDFTPGTGRRRPRADFHSDAGRLSLNGAWSFQLSPTARGTGWGFINDEADLTGWETITVPSHWVLEGQGHGDPLYTNTAYPFPIDPPNAPEENPTGDYRLTFDLPAGWTSYGSVLRFQGVDSCGKVWLNGTELGHSKGSRLPFEFAVGELLRPTGNVLAVRVHRWSSGSYLEDQDMWWLPGIFRDVELLERPVGGIDDFEIRADFDHRSGAGTLQVMTDVPGRIHLPELKIDGMPTNQRITVPEVQPWSAEQPTLYRGEIRVAGERIELVVGFRSVAIEDGRLIVNGVPILMRGVNRHEHHPDHGRALPPEVMRHDLIMMKRHNINAVRTSHYPPHPHFLTLCDELGLWVVDECDIETHGFIYTGWEGNPPADPRWQDALLDRTARMVERDKNHPSVLIWSLANESHTGEAFGAIEHWIRERDPRRPLHYERDPSYQHSDFYSLMYPTQEDLERIGRREEEAPEAVRALPFLLCEYAHAMGNGPGSLADYQRILEASDRFCGGFVWEWIDHGIRRINADGEEIFAHGGDIDYQPNGGVYCLDGLVFPDRTPSPGLIELAKVFEPVGLDLDVTGAVLRIHNKHAFADLGHLDFGWSLESDGIEMAKGSLSVPACPAGTYVDVPLTDVAPSDIIEAPGTERWLMITASLDRDEPWAPRGHLVAWTQAQFVADVARDRTPPLNPATARSAGSGPGRRLTLGPFLFDDAGTLTGWNDCDVTGPRLDVWRAPTDNDRGQGSNNNLVTGWRALGLDRMLHRLQSVDHDQDSITVQSRVAPAAQGIGLVTRYAWRLLDDHRVSLTVDVTPEGVWEDTPIGSHHVTLPRLGIRMALPGGYEIAEWFGRGPGESYADSLTAGRVGRHLLPIDRLRTDYVVPQENGNRSDVRWLELRGAGLPRLRIEGQPMINFTARRWSTESLDAAKHPYQLTDSGLVHLHLDHALHGLGSSACGPATPTRYQVPVQATSFGMTFSVAREGDR